MKIQRFEEMEVWKHSLEIAKKIYRITSVGKFAQDFGLRDQIRRASVSISSNIVEGFERSNNNEFIRFLKIAKGSAGEVRNQLHIALAAGYISQKEFDTVRMEMEEISAQIGAFISYLAQKKKNNEFIIR